LLKPIPQGLTDFLARLLTCQPLLTTLHFATSQPPKWSPSQVRSLQVNYAVASKYIPDEILIPSDAKKH
jgi:hypothetical protein